MQSITDISAKFHTFVSLDLKFSANKSLTPAILVFHNLAWELPFTFQGSDSTNLQNTLLQELDLS